MIGIETLGRLIQVNGYGGGWRRLCSLFCVEDGGLFRTGSRTVFRYVLGKIYDMGFKTYVCRVEIQSHPPLPLDPRSTHDTSPH